MAIVKKEYSLKQNQSRERVTKAFDSMFRKFGMPVFENNAVHQEFIDLICNRIKPDTVTFVKHKLGNDACYTYSLFSNGVLVARFRNGKLVKLSLPGVKQIDGNNYFLSTSGVNYVTYANFPDLVSVDDDFMKYAFELKFMSVPVLERTGEAFAYSSDELKTFFGPNLKRFGDHALSRAENLRIFYAPKLTKPGENCMYYNNAMKSVSMSNAKTLPNGFMFANITLKQENIYAPKLTDVAPRCADVFFDVMYANRARKRSK